MNKIFSILLLTASMAQAQTTLLCEDDFSSSSTTGCNIPIAPFQNLQRANGAIQYLTYSVDFSSYQTVDVYFNTSLLGYDTIKLEMDLRIMRPFSFYSNMILIPNYPAPINFNYMDLTHNKNYTGSINEDQAPPLTLSFPYSSTTYSSNKLITKLTNVSSSTFMNIQPFPPFHNFSNASWGQLNPSIGGNYTIDIFQDPEFVTKIKKAFCATTGNPTDCQNKVSITQSSMIPILFEIDNFKAYGIKNVITGLEDEIKPLHTRTLVGMYNSLGQKLDIHQTHEGLVIKMYSDGTKEKTLGE